MRRYPVAPLLEATGLSMSALAQRVGIGGGEYARVRSEGVTELAADRWANRLGLHPAEVWPDFGFALCADPRCAKPFAPTRAGHRYCSETCNSRHRRRVRYQQDADYAAARRARAKVYYEECREYVRRRQNAQRRAA